MQLSEIQIDLIVCVIVLKQMSRRIYRQEIKPVSWEAKLSLCVCFLPTLQPVFNRTRAESFSLFAPLFSRSHQPHTALSTFILPCCSLLSISFESPCPFALAFRGGRVWGSSAVKSQWMFIYLPFPTWGAPSWCVQFLVKDRNCKSLTAECDYGTFGLVLSGWVER